MPARPAPDRLSAVAAALFGLALAATPAGATPDLAKPADTVRIAVFNLDLARGSAGALAAQLRDPAAFPEARAQIDALAEIIQRVRPDILLALELDHDDGQEALRLFVETLRTGRGGAEGIDYPHRFAAPVNAGEPSGFDLDQDGAIGGPGDAFGWGVFPGQFGMAILSTLPIDREGVRRFRMTLWRDRPGAYAPTTEHTGGAYYTPEAWARLRLSSKSHWDAVIRLPDGRDLHVLASHPTPPVFDGPEDRNGMRNAEEIGFWRDYVERRGWMTDDAGRAGALPEGASFVILGDLNADPMDGDGWHSAIGALLGSPRLQDPRPRSLGAEAAALAQGGMNAEHQGPAAEDTADWRDEPTKGPGNLRVDYALPSADLAVVGAGVFWPSPGDPLHRLVGEGFPVVSSDHRLVWVDIAVGAVAE